jgi:two-component system, NarL family, nitrate/nitrite response regulator NarL
MSLPIVATHPSPLLHDGLRHLLAKSRFRPIRIATTLTDDLETYLISLEEGALWLTGVDQSIAATNELVRKVVTANPNVKAVIIVGSQEPEDIVAALKAGACGYLRQDIAGETLLKSLELIAHGEMVIHPQLVSSKIAIENERTSDVLGDTASHIEPDVGAAIARHTNSPSLSRAKLEESDECQSRDVPPMSRREMLILRMLMEGASNKTIARNLVITESTVKVHMKAILRKLRLHNRTQAAIWARNNVNENDWNKRTACEVSTH